MSKKIAGYYRLSVEDDDVKEESNSITNQRLLVKGFVDKKTEFDKYEFREFYDDGYSGTNMERPGITELLELVKKGEIECIIVKDLSRFSRDYIELGTYLEQVFPFLGVRFISITDNYDSINYKGIASDTDVQFKGLIADFYSKDISHKVKDANAALLSQGKYIFSAVPFGYTKSKHNRHKLVIESEEAAVVRRIFELVASGYKIRAVHRLLNEEEVLTPTEFKILRKKGALQEKKMLWSRSTIMNILKNEAYIGKLISNKSQTIHIGSSKTIKNSVEDWKCFPDSHEAIVSQELFVKVQDILANNKEKAITGPGFDFPLKGKIYCKHCDRIVLNKKASGKYISFVCRNRNAITNTKCFNGSVSNTKLEKVIQEVIKNKVEELVKWNEIQNEINSRRQEQMQNSKKLLLELEENIIKIKEQKRLLLEAYHQGSLSRMEFAAQKKALEKGINDSQTMVDKKITEISKLEKESIYVIEGFDDLMSYANTNCLTKELVEAFIEKIYIDTDKAIEVIWKINNGELTQGSDNLNIT